MKPRKCPVTLSAGHSSCSRASQGTIESHTLDLMEAQDAAEQDFLEHLAGVRAVNIESFEEEFGRKFDAAIVNHEQAVEERRLAKTREQILSLEQRIDEGQGRLGPARLGKLYDRLDELKTEEASILERISAFGEAGSHANGMPSNSSRSVEPPSHSITATTTSSSIVYKATEPVIRKRRKISEAAENQDSSDEADLNDGEDETVLDDFSDATYRKRLEKWLETNPDLTINISTLLEGKHLDDQTIQLEDCVDVIGYRCPRILHDRLLNYQKTGIEWLAGLFNKRVGGILGDEMVSI